MLLQQIKPKNARSKRALKKRQPQLIENPKKTLFLRSTSSSSLTNALVTDLHSLKRPLATRFTKKNAIHPFEDASSLEFFSQKNDTSLMCFSSHSKKRPHNLTFIRTFNAKVLDMMECLVDSDTARTLTQFGGPKVRVGTKPLISFSGPQFDDVSEECVKFRLSKSLFLDFFRGEALGEVGVEGLQMMITFAAAEEKFRGTESKQVVKMRVWRVQTRRSGQKLPRVELEEMGPRIDFRLGRIMEADPDLLKGSLKRSKRQDLKNRKNVETDSMGDKLGKIHLGRQNLNDLQARKMKGLKRERDGDVNETQDDSREAIAALDDEGDDEDVLSFIDEESYNSASADDTVAGSGELHRVSEISGNKRQRLS